VTDVGGVSSKSEITLREINSETVRTICDLNVREDQRGLVAPNAVSIAQAHFSDKAWFRAIYAEETPVGFIMLHDDAEKGEYFLWRMMIDARYQGMGFGRRAMEIFIDYVRSRPGAKELLTSVVQEEGSAQGFYERIGFELTGAYEGEEAVMGLPL
jgi:diamine N-acetyltransferase